MLTREGSGADIEVGRPKVRGRYIIFTQHDSSRVMRKNR